MSTGKVIYNKCRKCGRLLKSKTARERGYGPHCWHQHLLESNYKRKTLFDSFNLNIERK